MKSFEKTTKKIYKPLWVKEDFTTYNIEYIDIRSSMKYKADTCIKCAYKFVLGDTIGLACFKGIGNKVICNKCAKEIM